MKMLRVMFDIGRRPIQEDEYKKINLWNERIHKRAGE